MSQEDMLNYNMLHQDIINNIKKDLIKETKIADLADFFKVLGNFTRTKILFTLNKSELCVDDICNILNMTKSAISHQLAILRKARLVKSRKDGKSVYYSLDDKHVKMILESSLEHLYHIN